MITMKKYTQEVSASACMCSVPVHEIYEHLRIFLVLLHLHCVRQDHVQVKN